MKVLCVIKKGRGGSGVSSAARYVSTRDRDEEREGNQARALFSAAEDKLTASQANRFLGDGQEPHANDVLHVVISFEKEEDFIRLGNDEESRKVGVRETTRSAMKDIGDLFNADELRWAAGIHRNTDNPHVHLLIHRNYVDRETKREKRLASHQRELRLSWSSALDGERVTNPGALSQAFEKHLERNIEQAREDRERADRKLRGDRLTLGRAMLAEDAVERLQEMRNAAIAVGERRRYKIVDAQGRSRWLSERDLRLRAETRTDQALARLTPGWDPEVRRQLRSEAYL
ncbi:MAG: relaxase MobL, partial [Acidobacteria bacterium]|nr:relaxase MobL [Acidobacteriota bacterium]